MMTRADSKSDRSAARRWLLWGAASMALMGCSPDREAPARAAPTGTAAQGEPQAAKSPAASPSIDHAVRLLDGSEASLADWRGQALLLVNTASQCGLTPQYEELQALHERFQGRGLVVMGFPSNDFGGQEPGDARQIAEFVVKTYGITFPMFEKQTLKGAAKSPLYRTLTEELGSGLAGEVKWNFTKFLVNPEGHVVARFDSGVSPLDAEIIAAIEANLPSAR